MLVQDEPTSHLDMQSIEALQTCLKGYTGGIVLVTHDQHFCKSVAEKVPSHPFCLQKEMCVLLLLHCCPRNLELQKSRFHDSLQQAGDEERLCHEPCPSLETAMSMKS